MAIPTTRRAVFAGAAALALPIGQAPQPQARAWLTKFYSHGGGFLRNKQGRLSIGGPLSPSSPDVDGMINGLRRGPADFRRAVVQLVHAKFDAAGAF